jgi:hypothetical protein
VLDSPLSAEAHVRAVSVLLPLLTGCLSELKIGAEGTLDSDPQLCSVYSDLDGDGYGFGSPSQLPCEGTAGYADNDQDCDDGDSNVHPAATEICNGLDDDCDGEVDDDDESLDPSTAHSLFEDLDGDGFGSDVVVLSCEPELAGAADNDQDCDDGEAQVHPEAVEVCNGLDDDCDGDVDDDDSSLEPSTLSTWYADADADGYGDPLESVEACSPPEGYVEDRSDCEDGDAQVHPDASEVCNGIDDDCDDKIDDADASLDTSTRSSFYDDDDGDGYGDPDTETETCSPPSGAVSDATDCDDADAHVNPAQTEVCNGLDDDCDGDIDDDDSSLDTSTWDTFYDDTDGDGYGDPDAGSQACAAPSGTVADDTDCDDSESSVSPAETEVCNEVDDDCDGDIDDDDSSLDTSTQSTWYADDDLDGYGDAGATTQACEEPSGYVEDDTDCDDGDADVNPAASEDCNGIDDDCDGDADSDSVCPCDVERYGSHVYLFCDSASSWWTADSACTGETDFELAVVDDSSENTWLTTTLLTYSSSDWWWIGFHDQNATSSQEPASGWEWVDGSSVSTTNWASGQPVDWRSDEDCGHLYNNGTWNDLDCDRTSWGSADLYYICEATVSY